MPIKKASKKTTEVKVKDKKTKKVNIKEEKSIKKTVVKVKPKKNELKEKKTLKKVVKTNSKDSKKKIVSSPKKKKVVSRVTVLEEDVFLPQEDVLDDISSNENNDTVSDFIQQDINKEIELLLLKRGFNGIDSNKLFEDKIENIQAKKSFSALLAEMEEKNKKLLIWIFVFFFMLVFSFFWIFSLTTTFKSTNYLSVSKDNGLREEIVKARLDLKDTLDNIKKNINETKKEAIISEAKGDTVNIIRSEVIK